MTARLHQRVEGVHRACVSLTPLLDAGWVNRSGRKAVRNLVELRLRILGVGLTKDVSQPDGVGLGSDTRHDLRH